MEAAPFLWAIQYVIYFHVQEKLVQFVSVVSGGLSGELKKKDSTTRNMLDVMIEEVTKEDPEFILKVSSLFGSIIKRHD